MRIHVYAACWNDRPMLPFFVRHYAPWADRIVVYDDGSQDGSVEYLASVPRVEIRALERAGCDSTIERLCRLQDSCWKESRGRADWVVVVAVDEHLYHPDLKGYLATCRARGVTVVPAVGVEMVHETFPNEDVRLCDTIRRGVPFGDQHKLCVFDPDAIDDVHFGMGRHRAAPTGRVRYPAIDELRLFHYKHLGLDYVLQRTAALKTGLLAADVARGYGVHWLREQQAIAADFERLLAGSRTVACAGPCGVEHWTHRWWRRQWPWHVRCWDRLRYLRALRRPGGTVSGGPRGEAAA